MRSLRARTVPSFPSCTLKPRPACRAALPPGRNAHPDTSIPLYGRGRGNAARHVPSGCEWSRGECAAPGRLRRRGRCRIPAPACAGPRKVLGKAAKGLVEDLQVVEPAQWSKGGTLRFGRLDAQLRHREVPTSSTPSCPIGEGIKTRTGRADVSSTGAALPSSAYDIAIEVARSRKAFAIEQRKTVSYAGIGLQAA